MPTVQHQIYNDDGEPVTITFPATYEVCWRCQGEGKHVHPGVDGNGLSREDFDEDPDFREDYFNGFYDVTCEECEGKRVTAVIDEDHLDDEQKALLVKLEAQWEDEAASRRENEMERRMGA